MTPEKRNIISGNVKFGGLSAGILIQGPLSLSNAVWGNFIGTDKDGEMALGNGQGVWIAGGSFNSIGGLTPETRNVISGNKKNGILFFSGQISGSPVGIEENVVQGNFIGTNAAGDGALTNGSNGVLISDDALQNTIGGTGSGEGNVIAHNTLNGVQVRGNRIVGNQIQRNSIHNNGKLGINLFGGNEDPNGVTANDDGDGDTGPNKLQNFPVITDQLPVTVSGFLSSTPNTTFTLEFFANSSPDLSGFGEGETFLGSEEGVTTDDLGNALFSFTFPSDLPPGTTITATATDADGNTSEFSNAFELR